MFASFRVNRILLSLCSIAAAVSLAAAFCAAGAAAMRTAESVNGVRLPVIMYHSMLKEQKRLGKYVVSPDTFESDLQYLQRNGYQTVTVQDLVDYVHTQRPLPEKPVMLTFDDGYYNNYAYAYPLAKKYSAKMVIAPIGYYTDLFSKEDADHPNYSHLTWDEITEMMSSGLVEFQNHSYNLHATKGRLGAQKLRRESVSAYTDMLRRDVGKMQEKMEENTGYKPIAFIYPFGASSKESDSILKQMGFQATFLCTEKINMITKDPECLYSLAGFYVRPESPAKRISGKSASPVSRLTGGR